MNTKKTYSSKRSEEEVLSACRKIKHVALDMDGTIYLGSTLFDYTKKFLNILETLSITYSFLTNNPTKSNQAYLRKLEKLGLEVDKEQMYTSSNATIDYIHENYPTVKKLFILGTPSMITEFKEARFEIAANSAQDVPQLLVVAFDPTLTYDRLCRAAWWASQKNIPYIATNPDWVCPTDEPTILVDCGSLCRAIEGATKRLPDIVIGKPNPNMLYCIGEKFKITNDEIAMCGDRIYTDVATAQNAGSLGVLVLSGECSQEDANQSERYPDLVVDNIYEFGKLLIAAHQ